MATRTSLADLSPAASLPDILQFMQLLWTVVHGLQRTSKRMTATVGITGPQRLVLRVVGLIPGISAGDLAAILRVHPSTLTGVLERLVRQQLLTRADDPVDRRRAVLRLTALGARTNAIKRDTVEFAIANALVGVPARDRAATRRTLARIASHLEPAAIRHSSVAGAARPQRSSSALVRKHDASASVGHEVSGLRHETTYDLSIRPGIRRIGEDRSETSGEAASVRSNALGSPDFFVYLPPSPESRIVRRAVTSDS